MGIQGCPPDMGTKPEVMKPKLWSNHEAEAEAEAEALTFWKYAVRRCRQPCQINAKSEDIINPYLSPFRLMEH